MNDNRTTLAAIFVGLITLSICITACKGKSENHPAASLQEALSARLADPEVCPSGDSGDIQRFISAVGTDGMIHLPEGCFKINSTINIPACTQLVGAGADKTILYRDPEQTYSQPILRISGRYDAACQTILSGMSLLGVRDTHDSGEDYGIVIYNVHDFRIDHLYFEGFGFAGVRVEGASSGVIDHSIFVENYKQAIDNLGYGVVIYGKGYWDSESQVGGSGATFVEDSLFVGNRHAIAASAGAHYVFRSNQVLNGVVACAVDAHGMGYGSAHGTRYVEIYRNTISNPVYDWCGIGIRGGSGVIFENTIEGYKNPILLILEWGTPDNLKKEYPAIDQIQELYIWGNQIKGGPSQPQVDETGVVFIEAGRDYFTQALPGYVPYEYPHPLVSGSLFDADPWPPSVSP
jgi:Pectate lyase superfamily protein